MNEPPVDAEVDTIRTCYLALVQLPAPAQWRALEWLRARLVSDHFKATARKETPL